jgi:hypothetical protein
MSKSKPRRGNRTNPKPPRRTVSRGMIPKSRYPQWAKSVMEPFSEPPASIPDQLSAPSLKMKSLSSLTFTTSSPTANTSHGALVLIQPAPISSATVGQISYDPVGQVFVTVSNLETQVPNFTALFPTSGTTSQQVTVDDYRYRCTAMGVRLTYTGTELQRGARVVIGFFEPDFSSNNNDVYYETFGTAGLSLSGSLFPNQVLNRMTRYKVFREWDSTMEFESIPSGTPLYHQATQASGNSYLPLVSLSVSNHIPCLGIMITGDQTSVASTVGNNFDLEIVRHWEVICPSDLVTAIPMTPSPYDVKSLEYCLNVFGAAYSDFPVKSLDNSGNVNSSANSYAQLKKNAAYAAAAAATAYVGYRAFKSYNSAKKPGYFKSIFG